MDKTGKKVFVTGATGILGSRLVYDLLLNGQNVKALFRDKDRINQFLRNISFFHEKPQNLNSKVDWIEGDLLDYHSILKAVDGVDIVYHCAAMVSFHSSDYSLMNEINISGTSNIIDTCILKGVKKLCHVSSITSLGRSENGVIVNEESSWVPGKKHSGYSISKFHSEMEVWRGINEGLEAVIVNPSVILAPGDRDKGSPIFFNSINRGLRFYPPGGTGFVDVRDVSAAMISLTDDSNWSKCANERFLLNGSNLSYKEFFSLIAETLNVKAPDIKATKAMLGFIWPLAWIGGILTGKKPPITKENTEISRRLSVYDGSKISERIGFTYRNIEDTIKDIGNFI